MHPLYVINLHGVRSNTCQSLVLVKKHTDTLKGTERTSYRHRCPEIHFHIEDITRSFISETHQLLLVQLCVCLSPASHWGLLEFFWSGWNWSWLHLTSFWPPRPSAMLLFKHRLNCLFAFSLTNGRLWIFPCYLSRNLLHDPCSSVKPCTFIFRDKRSILKCILCVLTLIIRPTITKMLYFLKVTNNLLPHLLILFLLPKCFLTGCLVWLLGFSLCFCLYLTI